MRRRFATAARRWKYGIINLKTVASIYLHSFFPWISGIFSKVSNWQIKATHQSISFSLPLTFCMLVHATLRESNTTRIDAGHESIGEVAHVPSDHLWCGIKPRLLRPGHVSFYKGWLSTQRPLAAERWLLSDSNYMLDLLISHEQRQQRIQQCKVFQPSVKRSKPGDVSEYKRTSWITYADKRPQCGAIVNLGRFCCNTDTSSHCQQLDVQK